MMIINNGFKYYFNFYEQLRDVFIILTTNLFFREPYVTHLFVHFQSKSVWPIYSVDSCVAVPEAISREVLKHRTVSAAEDKEDKNNGNTFKRSQEKFLPR